MQISLQILISDSEKKTHKKLILAHTILTILLHYSYSYFIQAQMSPSFIINHSRNIQGSPRSLVEPLFSKEIRLSKLV